MTQPTGVEGAGDVSPATEAAAGEHDAAGDGHEEEAEPRYMLVWGGLAVLTLIEVWVASLALPKTAIVLVLVGLAVWKAALVALYYMHLKFEPRRLWILAAGPLPLAVILVMAVLQEF